MRPVSVKSLSVLRALPALLALFHAAAAPLAAEPPRFRPDSNLERSAVPDAAKWDLTPLFADAAAFEAGLAKAAAGRAALLGFRGSLAEPARLKACLDLYFETRLLVKKLSLWSSLRLVTDERSAAMQVLSDRGQKELSDFMEAVGFVRTEVLALPDAKMDAAYAREPGLAAYRPYLDELRRRRSRVLSAEAEKILAQAGDHLWAEIDLNEIPSPFEKIYRAARADIPLPEVTDENGRKVRLNFSNLSLFRSSPNRDLRRDAVAALFKTLKTHQDIYAGALAGEIGHHVFLARARGYTTALDAYMDKDNLPAAVYRALIEGVRANLGPLHRSVRLRKKALGLPDVHIYDLSRPLVAGLDLKVPYEEAAKTIVTAMAPLGADYGKVLATGLEPRNGWVDVYPHKDKESGAFSSFAFGVHPFVKMNYLEKYSDVSTLAHEMGHALQQHLSMTRQPYPSSDFSLTLSEIPSTFNEKLLSDHLLARAKTDDERLYLLTELVGRLTATIWRQALFAEYELAVATAIEKGESITAEYLNRTYRGLVQTYYGPDFVMDDHDDIEWALVPHFYYKFYMYSYAIGLSCGVALAEKVQTGGPAAREAYLKFLAGGSSQAPVELLRAAGVDLMKPDAVNAAARLMDRSLAEMESLLAKRQK